jgi:hypothetical protein
MRNSEVYFLKSECSWFAIILKFTTFLVSFRMAGWKRCACGTAEGCFTDIMLDSSVNYHQEHVLRSAAEPRRQHKDIAAACGAVMLRFHGVPMYTSY